QRSSNPEHIIAAHDCGDDGVWQRSDCDFRRIRLRLKWFEDDENYDPGHENRRSLVHDPEKTRVTPVCLFRQILPDFCEISVQRAEGDHQSEFCVKPALMQKASLNRKRKTGYPGHQ